MIVLYIVILIYFNFNIMSIVNVFMLSIEKKKWTPFMELNVGQFYSCSLKPFYCIFADIPASGSNFLWLMETEFSSNPSSRLVYTDFALISNCVLLFRAFFCCWKALLELGVNQFSSIFSVSNSASCFSG